MPTINAIAEFTTFDRSTITRRVKKFNLGKEICCKELFDLKPLDEAHAQKISLESARTDLAIEDTRLKRLQAEKIEGQLADIDEVLEAEGQLLEGIAAIIKASSLDDGRKEDIFSAIQDHAKQWAKNYGQDAIESKGAK